MKKNILSILTIMLILVSLVSCDAFNMGESGATKGLASISFVTNDGTKALSVSTDAKSLENNYIWWYKASKADGGPDQGETDECWFRVNENGAGLDGGVLTGFSAGTWNFYLEKTEIPSSGTPTTPSTDGTYYKVTLEAGKVNYIAVDVGLTQSVDGKGTLTFCNISVPDKGSAFCWSYSLDGGVNFTEFSENKLADGTEGTPSESNPYQYSVSTRKLNLILSAQKSGSYDVVIMGKYSSGDEYTVRKGEITVQVYDSLTTTISGSIDDLTTAVEFVGKVYTLSYNANISDGSSFTGSLPCEDKIGGNVAVASGISREGIEFLGWNTKADGTGDTYQPGDTILVKKDTTLYALWYYSVTYDGNGSTEGTVPVDSNVYNGGSKATVLAKPNDLAKTSSDNREAWVFLGWTDNEQGIGTIYQAGEEVAFNANTTLYAKWDQVKGFATTISGSGRSDCTWTVLWYEDTDNDGQNDATKWADFNVGSTITSYKNQAGYSSTIVGKTYKWGEVIGGDESSSTKDIQGTESDTAKYVWGSNWEMPTKSQFEALNNNCKFETINGTNRYEEGSDRDGMKFSGKDGTVYEDYSIFFPGYASGSYWTSTPYDSQYAYTINVMQTQFSIAHNQITNAPGAVVVRAIVAE